MIAVDTNVIVRLLTGDNDEQFKLAQSLFNNDDLFIPDTVLLETEWVLRCAYDFPAEQICAALKGLLGLKNVRTANPWTIAQALEWHQKGLDFADAMHLSQSQRQSALRTFDKAFIKQAKGLSKCQVETV